MLPVSFLAAAKQNSLSLLPPVWVSVSPPSVRLLSSHSTGSSPRALQPLWEVTQVCSQKDRVQAKELNRAGMG